jgi:hypothetical protein
LSHSDPGGKAGGETQLTRISSPRVPGKEKAGNTLGVCDDPGSAVHHFVLHRIREK